MMGRSRNYIKVVIAIVVIIIASFLLFYNLGYSALWDDEADTALFALSVWRTGDTGAILGHNLIAHTNGQELKGLRNRYIPPLPFYLAAPFVGLASDPGSALAARLPFAMCGMLTVVTMLSWLWRSKSSVSTWLLMAGGILGNVSLMLYSRQSRYYSITILATLLLAFLYFYRKGGGRTLWMIVLGSFLLLASNYLCYFAAYVCLILDYLLWGRRAQSFRPSELAIIFVPQIMLGGLLVSIYNPVGMSAVFDNATVPWWKSKIILFLWYLRELNSCEFGVGVLIFIAPLLYYFTGDKRLLRGPLGVFVYSLVVALLSPQQVGILPVAIIRYLAPVIPLCIFISVLSIQALTVRAKWLAIPLAILAFGTNVMHGGPAAGVDKTTRWSRVISQGVFRSTVFEYTKELISPPPSAYRGAAQWINQNLKDKDSVWVVPNFAVYPLMYHAPKVTYAWQLKKSSTQFNGLPEIHFMNQIPPDYIIAFGPYIEEVGTALRQMKERRVYYEKIVQIDRYWYDLIRPELFWHSFHEVKNYSLKTEAVYIFKKLN